MIRLIVALDNKLGLAKDGGQPWKIPEDEQYFTDQTKLYGGNVLSGSTTFKTYRQPLVDRRNFVLTHSQVIIEGVTLIHDLDKFLDDLQGKDLWVAGGADVFKQVIDAGKADELYITHIDADLNCDQFFPTFADKFTKVEESEPRSQNGYNFTYAKYSRSKP
ncbi:MAG: dihydrofolate reductase [Patescibacteria group bacterium]